MNEEVKESPALIKQLKKPQTAFSIYIQDVRLSLQEEIKKQGLKQTQFLSEASKQWNALSPEAKQKYVEMAQKQKDAYNAMRAQMPHPAEGDDDGNGDIPEDEANQLRSKTRNYNLTLSREIHVASNEPHQTNMSIRSGRLYTCEQISISSLDQGSRAIYSRPIGSMWPNC